MDSCKLTNLRTNDYTFYTNNMSIRPFTVIFKGTYGWNFSLSDPSSYILEKVKTGWDVEFNTTITRTHLPNFVNDHPEFFI